MLTSKMFMMGASGKMEPLTAKPALPLYCKIYCYGAGMSKRQAAVISEPNSLNGFQKIVYMSDYEQGFSTVDSHARPHSKKFGIGHYYDDNLELWDEEEVKKYIALAEIAVKDKQQKAQEKAEFDKKEREELPSRYPYLTTVKNHPKGYTGACGDNIRAELKHNFPGVKFSVRGEGRRSSTFNIEWTDGPTIAGIFGILRAAILLIFSAVKTISMKGATNLHR